MLPGDAENVVSNTLFCKCLGTAKKEGLGKDMKTKKPHSPGIHPSICAPSMTGPRFAVPCFEPLWSPFVLRLFAPSSEISILYSPMAGVPLPGLVHDPRLQSQTLHLGWGQFGGDCALWDAGVTLGGVMQAWEGWVGKGLARLDIYCSLTRAGGSPRRVVLGWAIIGRLVHATETRETPLAYEG